MSSRTRSKLKLRRKDDQTTRSEFGTEVSSDVGLSVSVSGAEAAPTAPQAAKKKVSKSKKVDEANNVTLTSSKDGKVTAATATSEVAAGTAPKAGKSKDSKSVEVAETNNVTLASNNDGKITATAEVQSAPAPKAAKNKVSTKAAKSKVTTITTDDSKDATDKTNTTTITTTDDLKDAPFKIITTSTSDDSKNATNKDICAPDSLKDAVDNNTSYVQRHRRTSDTFSK
jgi:uncharacterized cupredoxin-like copper-binding protein